MFTKFNPLKHLEGKILFSFCDIKTVYNLSKLYKIKYHHYVYDNLYDNIIYNIKNFISILDNNSNNEYIELINNILNLNLFLSNVYLYKLIKILYEINDCDIFYDNIHMYIIMLNNWYHENKGTYIDFYINYDDYMNNIIIFNDLSNYVKKINNYEIISPFIHKILSININEKNIIDIIVINKNINNKQLINSFDYILWANYLSRTKFYISNLSHIIENKCKKNKSCSPYIILDNKVDYMEMLFKNFDYNISIAKCIDYNIHIIFPLIYNHIDIKDKCRNSIVKIELFSNDNVFMYQICPSMDLRMKLDNFIDISRYKNIVDKNITNIKRYYVNDIFIHNYTNFDNIKQWPFKLCDIIFENKTANITIDKRIRYNFELVTNMFKIAGMKDTIPIVECNFSKIIQKYNKFVFKNNKNDIYDIITITQSQRNTFNDICNHICVNKFNAYVKIDEIYKKVGKPYHDIHNIFMIWTLSLYFNNMMININNRFITIEKYFNEDFNMNKIIKSFWKPNYIHKKINYKKISKEESKELFVNTNLDNTYIIDCKIAHIYKLDHKYSMIYKIDDLKKITYVSVHYE